MARLLGQKSGVAKSEQLFIAGLLHDIGHLVLYSKLPQHALEARQIAEDQRISIHDAEVQVLGCHYGDVGAMLMANWNLPERLQTLTRHQPVPAGAGELEIEATLLHLARTCAQSGAKDFAQTAATPLDAQVQAVTGLAQEQLESSLDEARSISADMEKIILA
jgi:HD-like signal output (HDOD) protein